MVDYPEGTFADAAKRGAGGGFIVGSMLSSGGSFAALPLSMAISTVGNVIKHGIQSAVASNEDAKLIKAKNERNAAYQERRQANAAARTASLNPHITKSYKRPK